jgi:hypothetical protein
MMIYNRDLPSIGVIAFALQLPLVCILVIFLRLSCASIRNPARVKLDGVSNGNGSVIHDKSRACNDVARESGVYIADNELRPFQFSSLTLTGKSFLPSHIWLINVLWLTADDEDAPRMSDLSSNLGTIILSVERIKVLHTSNWTPPRSVIPDNLVLHESSKKTGAHRVRSVLYNHISHLFDCIVL